MDPQRRSADTPHKNTAVSKLILPPKAAKSFPRHLEWTLSEPYPCMLRWAYLHYGIMEHPGKGSFADFSKWAKDLQVGSVMYDDDVPWCGLLIGKAAQKCGYRVPEHPYRAKSWLGFGIAVPFLKACYGDLLIFGRHGGGHVGFYIGEDPLAFLVYGGNQSNMINFTWILKARLLGVRMIPFSVIPYNRTKRILSRNGDPISINEA
jgi:uncharacterized protein (TIGR02594 family)